MAIELPIGLSCVGKVWATFCTEFNVERQDAGYRVSSPAFERTLALKSYCRRDVAWLFQVLKTYPSSMTADAIRRWLTVDQHYVMAADWADEPLTVMHVTLRKYSEAPASNLMWHLLRRMPGPVFSLLAKVTVLSIQKEIDACRSKLKFISMLELSSAVFSAWYDALDDLSSLISAPRLPFQHRDFPYFKGVLGWDTELLVKHIKPVLRALEDDEFSAGRDLSVESALILVKTAMPTLDHEFFADALSQLVAPATAEQEFLRKAKSTVATWPSRKNKLMQAIASGDDLSKLTELNVKLEKWSSEFEQATTLCQENPEEDYLVNAKTTTELL